MNLSGNRAWSNVYQLESTDDAQGGTGGILNAQAQALLERSEYIGGFLVGQGGLLDISSVTTLTNLTAAQSGKIIYIGNTTSSGAIRNVAMPECDASGVDIMPKGTTFMFFNDSPTAFINVARPSSSTLNRFYLRDAYENAQIIRPYEVVTYRRINGGASPAWFCVSRLDLVQVMEEGMETLQAATVTPNRTLACNGAAVSRLTYYRLFNKIGVTYGVGNGSTTFNLPNRPGTILPGTSNTANYSIYF